MPTDELSFNKVAAPAPKPGSAVAWSVPQLNLDLGGNLAVWAEQGLVKRLDVTSRPYPWLVLHGGPGGSLGAAHVAPLRSVGLPWFGFDQRNSGLSEDLDLNVIDLQLFVDDAIQVADSLNVPKFHILGGSWGGTLALAIANYRPDRVASLVLRAPFIPIRPRVDAFFESLERVAPDYFAEHFGPGARTKSICDCFDKSEPEQLLELALAWNTLEHAMLLGKHDLIEKKKPFLTDVQEFALVRKYRLQSHFLKYDCFFSQNDWNDLLASTATQEWPLTIVQGLNDRVCPPGGAKMLSEMILRTTLIELPDTGHLADSGNMISAISHEVSRHRLMA